MTAQVITAAQILLGSADVSPFTGNLDTSQMSVKVNDATHFAAGRYAVNVAGIRAAQFGLSGWSDFTAATGLNALFTPTALGSQLAAAAIIPPNPDVAAVIGDPAVFTRGILATYTPWGGKIGENARFQMGLTADTAVVTGQVLLPLASRGAITGTQPATQSPAVTATQRVYGALFVDVAVGTNLAVTIQSAATGDAAFASPTTRITFATVSAVGWQFLSIPGPVTDTRWRAVATVGGSTFVDAVVFGIA